MSNNAGTCADGKTKEEHQNQLLCRVRACVNVQNRTHHLRTYARCFVGREAVDAMCASGLARDRGEAVQLGNALLEAGHLFHVTKDHGFKDEHLFYRFNTDVHWVQIDPSGFWNIRGSFKLKIGPVTLGDCGTHMSLIKRANGKFVVIDAIELTEETKKELDALTQGGALIEAVLAVHPFHTLSLPAFHALYPAPKYYGCPRHLKKLTAIPWAGDLGCASTRALFEPDLAMRIPDGVEFISPKPPASNHFASVLVLHRPSGTIHADDTFNFFVEANAVFKAAGIKPRQLQFHNSLKWALEDPLAYSRFLQRLLDEWDFDNICTAHSGNKIGGAKAELVALAQTVQPLLEKLAAEAAALGPKEPSLGDAEASSKFNSEGDECG